MKKIVIPSLLTILSACSSPKYNKTVAHVDRDKFMGNWHVMAGRFTPVEKDVYNSIETYKWNEKEKRIDIDFRYNKGGFDGELKKYPQKAWIESSNNARWKVQPFWPLKFDYLVIGLADDYRWTAIGVPNEKYLWIMSKDPRFSQDEVKAALKTVQDTGYDVSNIEYVPHGK